MHGFMLNSLASQKRGNLTSLLRAATSKVVLTMSRHIQVREFQVRLWQLILYLVGEK